MKSNFNLTLQILSQIQKSESEKKITDVSDIHISRDFVTNLLLQFINSGLIYGSRVEDESGDIVFIKDIRLSSKGKEYIVSHSSS